MGTGRRKGGRAQKCRLEGEREGMGEGRRAKVPPGREAGKRRKVEGAQNAVWKGTGRAKAWENPSWKGKM